MHILVILLIAAVLLADQGVQFNLVPAEGWQWVVPAVAFLPPLICLLIEMVLIRRAVRSASTGQRTVIQDASRRLRFIQWLSVLCSVVALLGMGWLELLRAQVGDLIWLDELLAIVPALILVCLTWFVQWPLERLVREALIIRRLDQGMPIHPVPTRSAYLLVQIRSQLLIILMPAIVVLLGRRTCRCPRTEQCSRKNSHLVESTHDWACCHCVYIVGAARGCSCGWRAASSRGAIACFNGVGD